MTTNRLTQIQETLSQRPWTIFLLDAGGALLSVLLHAVILVMLVHLIGMPKAVLYKLAMLAGLYFLYAFTCYLIVRKRWRIFLQILAVLNLLYCVLTVWLVVWYWTDLTMLGVSYFTVEVLIIASLAVFEWKLATKS